MTIETITLLENTNTVSADSTYAYTDKNKGAGFHHGNDGTHTAYYSLDSFIGSVKMQGTLAQYPGDNDWVDIADTELGFGDDSSAFSANQTFNFTGRFVWVRAAYNIQNGTINAIRYNL